jgi:SAM-dependent methyltransferase
VIGDGSVNCVRYDDFRGVASEVRRLLRDDGVFVLRCYVQPAVQERPEDVFADMFCAAIPSFHHFKFRLLMAMQQSAREGIPVNDVYQFWASRNVDLELLISRTGWERSAIEMMELYRGQYTVHTFPTLPEWRSVLHEFFDEVCLSTPSYNLGECCPTLVLRRRL